MIKIKRIIPFILAVCMILSLCVSLGCSTKKELNSLSLDTSNAKINFSLGEEYRPSGLVVTANYKSGKSETIDTNAVTIDSGSYDAYTLGTYDITVSYASEGTTAEATYQVNVVNALFGGLVVSLKTGRQQRYDLAPSMKTVDFTNAANWIEVRKPDANGEVDMNSAALSKDSYSVKVYKNGEELTELSAVKRGVYQIVASMYDAKEDFTFEGFTLITVFDDVKSITFKEGTTEQPRGLREIMTPTWKFTVTYNSGDTEVVDMSCPYLTLTRINPNVSASGGTATATYGEPQVLSAPATSVRTVGVPYKLTGKVSNPALAILNFSDGNVFEADKNKLIGTVVYKSGNTEFEIVGGAKGKIVGDKSATFDLPTGISIDGKTTYSCSQAFQSGGASSAEGMYIHFVLDRNCEIYIYAKANGTEERCMFLETEGDYATINGIEGYLGISGVPTLPSDQSNCSVHAASITGLDKENPADFQLTFDTSINVFYILIIFPEEAK